MQKEGFLGCVQNTIRTFPDTFARWAVSQIYLVDLEEHCFIQNERRLLTNRAPGKYDDLALVIQWISSINPQS